MSGFAARLTGDVSRRTMLWLAALFAALIVAPWVMNDYLVTVLILILYRAYTGQAWNIMMGFAGQLSTWPCHLCGAGRMWRRCCSHATALPHGSACLLPCRSQLPAAPSSVFSPFASA